MKILILTPDIYTHSGIARYTWTLASTLGDLIGPDNVQVLALLDLGGLRDAPKGFRVLDVTTEKLTRSAKVRFALRAAWRGGGYDLVVCSLVALAPIAAAVRRLHGTPFWVACHDAEVWNRIPALKLAGLRRAQLALPVSRFTADKLSAVNGIPRERIRVLYNAVPDQFAAMLITGKGRSGGVAGPGRERYILSIGSLAKAHAYKGFDMVIRAMPRLLAEVPNVTYVIVGTGDDQPRLESLASEAGVSEKVVFAGHVSDRALADFYHGCEVFVMPSRASRENGRWRGEGFGRVYVEAALAGKPVVGSTGGGAAEAVVHGRTGLLVDPASVSEISSALLILLQDAGLAKTMGCEGRSWAARTFTQSSLRSQLAELIGAAVHIEVRS